MSLATHDAGARPYTPRSAAKAWRATITLAALRQSGAAMTPSALGRLLGVDLSTLHAALTALTALGAVERSAAPKARTRRTATLYRSI